MAPSNADEAAIIAKSYWEMLQEDVLATVDEYEEAGYDAAELHPGMTAVVGSEYDDDHSGLHILVLEGELRDVESLVNSPGFEGADVYATKKGNIVLLGVFLKSEEPKRALGFPTYYLPKQAENMLEEATERGSIDIVLATQFGDSLQIECENPSLFIPEEPAEPEEPEQS